MSTDNADVASLRALLALRDIELHLLVLLKVAVAIARDRAEVHEDVGATVVLGDEAEALLAVEPLHGSCRHVRSSFRARTSLTAARGRPVRRPERELHMQLRS